ncbi:DNA ligase D [Amycolatopsis sp. CA-230715]|uniref:DNA ligase D n=1 Tax=Amycolatopsis sp. CA-230715 TaxID=2745196 RepID=UPI001C012F88|nr:DNA ligase D [Amycolatopsis sp. CA-230715]QWF85826.1 Multifunctional non-homologous end joining protein LigD [Amycolatopsis sp. CA-230715]
MVRTERSTAVPAWVDPMLAKSDGGQLPARPGLVYEPKYDGYRCCYRVAPDGGSVLLTSRNNQDMTAEFAELTGVFGDVLGGEALVLDGEVVVYDELGRPDFELLQQRRGAFQQHPRADRVPARFLAFDLLQLGDRMLLDQPYELRRRLLSGLPMPDPYKSAVVPAFTFEELAADRQTPESLLARVAGEGMEGVVAKVATAVYRAGRRSDAWLKHPITNTAEVVVCGYREGQGSLAGTVGGLLLGAHDPDTGDLEYLGDVGTGFSQAARAALRRRLETLERPTHPFATTPPREDTRRARWLDPVLVGEVTYRRFTEGAGRLRHTAWRGLREDKKPIDVFAPRPLHRTKTAPSTTATPASGPVSAAGQLVQVEDRQLTLSNLDKVLYPRTGFTKREVILYYSLIAPVLLPQLARRPVTFLRFPDGVDGEQWFAKNVPSGAPPWLNTAQLPSRGTRGHRDLIEYPLLDDLPALVWAANLAALELHTPQWTIRDDGQRRPPDQLVFDLDPGPGVTIVECCAVAERLHEILTADGLTAFPKTSGSKGMQLLCPIETDQPDAPSAYAKRLAQQLAAETPDEVTAVMAKARRGGRVLVDWSQNNPAKTTITAYSLRGRDEPTVSTPITWDEVAACRDGQHLGFTSDEVLARVEAMGDLLAEMPAHRSPLPGDVHDA